MYTSFRLEIGDSRNNFFRHTMVRLGDMCFFQCVIASLLAIVTRRADMSFGMLGVSDMLNELSPVRLIELWHHPHHSICQDTSEATCERFA